MQNPESTEQRVRYHSRHIPLELLNLDTRTGLEAQRNGLCDTLEPDMLARLAKLRVELIETRLVWWEMEKQPGRFDFSRLERDLRRIEQGGMKAGVFAWFQHPPEWYDPAHKLHVRFRCIEHDQDSTILSPWDPKTLEVYDRLYGELARRFGGRLAFLYAGVSGDFGEVCYPSGGNHYLFSPPHNHGGFWCGDKLARREFAERLENQYGNIARLNAAWDTAFTGWRDDLMPALPMTRHNLARRQDFAFWYVDALMKFTDAACKIARGHFPRAAMGIPLGFPCEKLAVGQIKSRSVKIAAKHRMIARWTGMAFLGDFEKTNVLARRFASAAHFYGAQFATEAALTLPRESAADGLYESAANGAVIIHDDPQNILRAGDVHERLRPNLFCGKPVAGAAVLYPLLDELLELDGFSPKTFLEEAGLLRRQADYEVCDHEMIQDGFLDRRKDLILLTTVHVPPETGKIVEYFVQKHGRVWCVGESDLFILDARGKQSAFPVKPAAAESAFSGARHGGLYRTAQYPALQPYRQLIMQYGPHYYTVHDKFISCYRRKQGTIDISPLPD